MGTSFRVFHLSDLHFGRHPERVFVKEMWLPHRPRRLPSFDKLSSHSPDLVEAATRLIFHRPELDLVLISGDLATTGHEGDLDAGHRYVTSAPTANWWTEEPGAPQTLGFLKDRVAVMPGNHDRLSGHVPFSPGNRAFDAKWDDWRSGRDVTLRKLEKDGETLAFVVADYCLRRKRDASPPGFSWGQGRVYPEPLKLAMRATRRLQSRGIPVVWVVHFPPDPQVSRSLQLCDGQTLLDAAEELGVNHVLAGHIHELTEFDYQGASPVTVHCAGTAALCTAAPTEYGMCEFEFVVDGGQVELGVKREFRWSEHDVRYVESAAG